MTIKQLKATIANMPDEWPVYFRRIAPLCGNVEEAGTINADKYSSFGTLYPCAIIEPVKDDEENTHAETGPRQDAAPKRPIA